MRLPHTLLTLLIASLLPSLLLAADETAGSEALADRAAIHASIDAFMTEAAENRIAAAYQQLRPYLGVASAPYDQSATEASAYFQRVTEQVGQPLSNVHVRTEDIGEEFYRESWLQKFDAAAIAWTFTFYQPSAGWKLVGVSYSTDIEPLYRDAR